ncbi:MAG TPA: hydrogenase expression/formation protein HypE [Armatimonadota bacterium]|nr:hydrogenase expression/formation protein HypE [Armatimonadota bacterium]
MNDDIILLAHGAGGKKSADLISGLFLRYFGNPILDLLGDSAIVQSDGRKLAFTTDSFVVDPLFFPGGDIGKLAVYGTVNDLAAAGAGPLALSAAFILEEGLDFETLERVAASMRDAAADVGIPIVAGDTKVVTRGSADRMFITTSGIGLLPDGKEPPSPERAAPGDMVILSGTIADHGMAVMACREGIRFSSEIQSDCAPLHRLVAAVLEAAPNVHCLRDPTRGGLAATLNELAARSGVCIEIEESGIPVKEDVRVACELLGIDPLHVASEGRMVAIVPHGEAEMAVAAMRRHPNGTRAEVIGRVQAAPAGRVHLRTAMGSLRVLDVPSGDLLPRIC